MNTGSRYLWLIILLGTIPALNFAQRLQRLSDSLTVYAQSKANVEKVEVKSCSEKGKQITLTTNPTLSHLSLSPDELKDLYTRVSLWVRGDKQGQVSIYSDKKELTSLITSRYKARPDKDKHRLPQQTAFVENIDLPYRIHNGLNGKNIALWGSHGLYYKEAEDRWLWQRARLWTTVEDVFTSSFTSTFLVPMLENAGAIILQPRERDIQTAERVTYAEGRKTQSLAMPVKDEYALYIRYKATPQSSPNAVYTVVHQGYTTRFEINQQMGGDMWLYLGTFCFGSDSTDNYLSVSDKSVSNHIGVKIGGGIGESGQPRFVEAARYFLKYSGIPDSVFTYEKEKNEYLDDLVSRGKWVNYLNENKKIPVSLALAVHSDAGIKGGDSIVGTLAIYADKDKENSLTYKRGGSRMCNRDLADYVQTQMVEDMRRTVCPQWARRELKNGGYAEARIPRVPTLLIEMLSHQNFNDMQYGLDAKTKFILSRAIYKGVLRFLHDQDGTDYVVQPLPVSQMSIKRKDKKDIVQLSWRPRIDTLEQTAQPTYYVVYTKREGQDWNNGKVVKDTTVEFTLERGTRFEFYVRAGNNGGLSMPSEKLCAYISEQDTKRALIVTGFTQVSAPEINLGDSLSGGILPRSYAIPYGTDVSYIGEQTDYMRRHQWVSDDECGWGMCANDYAYLFTKGNTFDYALLHGEMLQRKGYSYISTSLEAWDDNDNISLLDLTLGKQQEGLSALSAHQRQMIEQHIHNSGDLLISGSYLASGMTDKALSVWAQTTLHCRRKAPDASQSGIIFWQPKNESTKTYHLFTQPNEYVLPCQSPDGIEPTMVGERMARYADTGLCAAVATGRQIIVLAFMLESVREREELFEQCINYLEHE